MKGGDALNKTVAVITPTYNRAHLLSELYDSLLNQSCFDFVWYIVDDGSTDNTEELCRGFKTDKFRIEYLRKENGGKHTALNVGIARIEAPLTFIVDSDDSLTPDAIYTIVRDWDGFKDDPEIAGISYYKLHKDGRVVGDEYPGAEIIGTYLDVRVNQNIMGDKAEVYRTDILKTFKFPVFEGERFLSEAVVWSAISRAGYKLVYLSKGIYVCEYLNGGLTASGRKYRLQNPFGTMEHAKAFLCNEVKLILRAKYMLLYIATSFFAPVSLRETFEKIDNLKWLYVLEFIPGWLLSKYWKRKFKL